MKTLKQRTLIILLITFCTTTLFAHKRYDNRELTPLYSTYDISANYSLNENTRFGKFSSAIGIGAKLGVGKEFTPLWGWRATVGYNLNRGRSSWKSDSYPVKFHDIELFADGTLDITDLFSPNRSNKAFNAKIFLGIGYLQTFSFTQKELVVYSNYSQTPQAIFGFRGGLNASYNTSDNFAISLEASLSCMLDKYNGVVNGIPLDGRANIALGCIWYFNQK